MTLKNGIVADETFFQGGLVPSAYVHYCVQSSID